MINWILRLQKDGTTFRLSDYNIQVADIKVQGIETTDKYQEFEGCHGRQLTSSVYHKRKILVPVFLLPKIILIILCREIFCFNLFKIMNLLFKRVKKI